MERRRVVVNKRVVGLDASVDGDRDCDYAIDGHMQYNVYCDVSNPGDWKVNFKWGMAEGIAALVQNSKIQDKKVELNRVRQDVADTKQKVGDARQDLDHLQQGN